MHFVRILADASLSINPQSHSGIHAFTPYAQHFYTKNICVSAKNVVILQRNSKVLVCRHIKKRLLLTLVLVT